MTNSPFSHLQNGKLFPAVLHSLIYLLIYKFVLIKLFNNKNVDITCTIFFSKTWFAKLIALLTFYIYRKIIKITNRANAIIYFISIRLTILWTNTFMLIAHINFFKLWFFFIIICSRFVRYIKIAKRFLLIKTSCIICNLT